MTKYNQIFPENHSVIVAIHAKEINQTMENVKIAIDNWIKSVFLVDHEFDSIKFLPIVQEVKSKYDNIWLWVNMLWISPEDVFPLINTKNLNLDWVWVDNPYIWAVNWEDKTQAINESKDKYNFEWLYFWWVAFKGQRPVADIKHACIESKKHMDVITTSWPWTWMAADVNKVIDIKRHIWDFPLALASWVSLDNIHTFIWVSSFIVNTSISKDFYNLDPKKVNQLMRELETMNW